MVNGERTEGRYVLGKQDGEYRAWYANGKQKLVGHYLADREHGERKEWHADGRLNFEAVYIDGKQVSVRTFDSKRPDLPPVVTSTGIK